MSASTSPEGEHARGKPRGRNGGTPSIVRIGMLGLGNVGQAVARLVAASRGALRRRGLDFIVSGVLVRHAALVREFAPRDAQVTDVADEFLAGNYDLAIEVMGGVHPAFDYVERLLKRGIPVVSANKSLMAAHGVELFQTAAEHGTSLRCEASAIAGVPFLSALRDRPLVSRVQSISAILNGTSNYIVTSMDVNGVSFEDALHAAQVKGFAEPDPTLDVEGVDAAEKLVVILEHIGITGVRTSTLEIVGLRDLCVSDFQQARAFGGVIKPVVSAQVTEDTLRAFIGPAFVAGNHAFAGVNYERNGIRLRGNEIGDLVFIGPGAGPEVTAATIIDDAVQIITEGPDTLPPAVVLGRNDRRVEAPVTPWFVRATLPVEVPAEAALKNVLHELNGSGVSVRRFGTSTDAQGAATVHALTNARAPHVAHAAAAALRTALAADVAVFRVLDE
jgi:homoserine dehydrogenase